jgi:Spy/CpxP family protein refolding chaperone
MNQHRSFWRPVVASVVLLFSGGVYAEHGMMMDMDDDMPMHYGLGMMGGGPMGPGTMMGFGNMSRGSAGGPMHMMRYLFGLDLSKEQRSKILDLMRDAREKHWELMDQRMAIWGELGEAYSREKPDPEKTAAIYGKLFDIKQSMIQQELEIKNKVSDILTDEQKERFRGLGYGHGRGYGHGYGPHHMMR